MHEAILRRHFLINDTLKGWISFERLDGRQLAGFGTARVAKLLDGRRFVFTIGETKKGKRNGL